MLLEDVYEDLFGHKSDRKAYKFASLEEAAKVGLDPQDANHIAKWTEAGTPHIFILAESYTDPKTRRVVELYDDVGYGHLLLISNDEIQMDTRGEFIMTNDMEYVGIGPYYHCQAASRLYRKT